MTAPEPVAGADALSEAERLRDLMRRIGFGDGITEPMADNDTVVEFIDAAIMDQSEHHECPITCELCGERLADKPCPHCGGCGANVALSTAALAYAECEWCAGAGKVHEGCAEKSYADLAAAVADLRADLDAARAQVAAALAELTDDEAAQIDWHMNEHMYGHSISNSVAGMACDVGCRTRQLGLATSNVLAARRAALDAPAAAQPERLDRSKCNGCVDAAFEVGTTARPLRSDGHDVACSTAAAQPERDGGVCGKPVRGGRCVMAAGHDGGCGQVGLR